MFCHCYFEILVFDGKAWRNVWTSFACVTRPSQISGRTWAAKAAWISYVQVCMYTYCSDTFVMKVWSLSNFVFPSSSLGISGETGSCYRLTSIMARRTLCKTLLKKWMLYHQLLFTLKKTVELQSSINLSADSFSFEDVVSVVGPVVWQPRCNAYAYEAAVAADLGFTKIANGVEHQTV